MSQPPWLSDLRAALDAEFASSPRVAALATADERGRPRVRSVVCRRVEEDGSIGICSDARSAKNAQVRANPAAELVFWLPGCREQFRLAGRVDVLSEGTSDPRREALWGELSDQARALFYWPEPGEMRDSDPVACPHGIPAGGPVPGRFEVLLLVPEEVDHLDLKTHPHRRRRWRREAGWREEQVNP